MLLADLDGDRDLDLIVLQRRAAPQVFLNDLLWDYEAGDGFDAFIARPCARPSPLTLTRTVCPSSTS